MSLPLPPRKVGLGLPIPTASLPSLRSNRRPCPALSPPEPFGLSPTRVMHLLLHLSPLCLRPHHLLIFTCFCPSIQTFAPALLLPTVPASLPCTCPSTPHLPHPRSLPDSPPSIYIYSHACRSTLTPPLSFFTSPLPPLLAPSALGHPMERQYTYTYASIHADPVPFQQACTCRQSLYMMACMFALQDATDVQYHILAQHFPIHLTPTSAPIVQA